MKKTVFLKTEHILLRNSAKLFIARQKKNKEDCAFEK